MKIATFNVNGLGGFMEYLQTSPYGSFSNFVQALDCDIYCFQETKTSFTTTCTIGHPSHIVRQRLDGCEDYGWLISSNRNKRRTGYSGVLTLYRLSYSPKAYSLGFSPSHYHHGHGHTHDSHHDHNDEKSGPIDSKTSDSSSWRHACSKVDKDLDEEGRLIITDHEDFILFNVYFPLASDPDRALYQARFQTAIEGLTKRLLEIGKTIILAGDFNATYHELDHCDYCEYYCDDRSSEVGPKPLIQRKQTLEPFYSLPRRQWFRQLLDKEFVDPLRYQEPNIREHYTCWNQQTGARASNYGTRIDYILIDKATVRQWERMYENIDTHHQSWGRSWLRPDVFGSDHCPVLCEFPLWTSNASFPVVTKKKRKTIESYFFGQDNPSCSSTSTVSGASHHDLTSNMKRRHKNLRDYFQPSSIISDNSIKGESLAEAPIKEEEEEEDITKTVKASSAVVESHIQSILKEKAPPLCPGHSEPCKLYKVKKKGHHQGRHFYLCPRPTGSLNNPQSRCNYFRWFK